MTKRFMVCFALVAMACGSGIGIDLEDILGSTGADDRSDIRGYVQSIDTSARRIDLDVEMVNNLRDSRPGSTVYYDSSTVVEYQNREYQPSDLERGDLVGIEGANVSGRFVASRITVIDNVRE